MLLDFPSRQDILDLSAKIDKLLACQAAPVVVDSELMTLDEVAAYTRFDRRTVRKWVSEGQFGLDGRKIYLPASTYGDTLRFKRSDVEAFGQKVGVLTPAVAGQQPAPTKQAAPKRPTRKPTPVPSEAALKVA